MGNLFGIALLLVGVVASVHYLDDATANIEPSPAVATAEKTIPAQTQRNVELQSDARGHFNVDATINGRSVSMVADTGASTVALTFEDARRAGFNPGSLDYSLPVHTANGTTHAARVCLDTLDVGGIVIRDVEAMVLREGLLRQSLLGMSYIGRLARFSVENGRLMLVE